MIVIADATPLNYLILIDQAELLPRLFDRILIPPAVFEELQHQETPDVVRRWIARPPSWLHVQALRSVLDPALGLIQESGKPSPSRELHADQLLLDDADARREAARRSLPFIWTLASCAKRHAAISSICETLWFNCRRPASLSIPR
jgi:predicted nucleic acid-binding protein